MRAHQLIFALRPLQFYSRKDITTAPHNSCTEVGNTYGSTTSSQFFQVSPKLKLWEFQIETELRNSQKSIDRIAQRECFFSFFGKKKSGRHTNPTHSAHPTIPGRRRTNTQHQFEKKNRRDIRSRPRP